jgi:hypothetical protein
MWHISVTHEYVPSSLAVSRQMYVCRSLCQVVALHAVALLTKGGPDMMQLWLVGCETTCKAMFAFL